MDVRMVQMHVGFAEGTQMYGGRTCLPCSRVPEGVLQSIPTSASPVNTRMSSLLSARVNSPPKLNCTISRVTVQCSNQPPEQGPRSNDAHSPNTSSGSGPSTGSNTSSGSSPYSGSSTSSGSSPYSGYSGSYYSTPMMSSRRRPYNVESKLRLQEYRRQAAQQQRQMELEEERRTFQLDKSKMYQKGHPGTVQGVVKEIIDIGYVLALPDGRLGLLAAMHLGCSGGVELLSRLFSVGDEIPVRVIRVPHPGGKDRGSKFNDTWEQFNWLYASRFDTSIADVRAVEWLYASDIDISMFDAEELVTLI